MRRVLEELDSPVLLAGPPARLLVSDRGSCQQVRVIELASDLRRGVERIESLEGLARFVLRHAELDQHLGASPRRIDPQLQRGQEHLRRLLERDCRYGSARRLNVVVDRPANAVERGRRGEMIGEVGEDANGSATGTLERLADAQVQFCPADARQAVVDGAAHELVRKPVCKLPSWQLDEDPAAGRFVHRIDELALAQAGASTDQAELELRAGRRGQLEHLGGGTVEPGESAADDLAHTLGRSKRRRRAAHPQLSIDDLDRLRLCERPPELTYQERVSTSEIPD